MAPHFGNKGRNFLDKCAGQLKILIRKPNRNSSSSSGHHSTNCQPVRNITIDTDHGNCLNSFVSNLIVNNCYRMFAVIASGRRDYIEQIHIACSTPIPSPRDIVGLFLKMNMDVGTIL